MNLLLNRHGRPFWAATLFVATLSLSACGSDGSPTAAGESADDRDLSLTEDPLSTGTGTSDVNPDAPVGDAPSTIAPGEFHPDTPLTTVDGLVDHLRALGAEVSYEGDTLEPSFHLPAAHQLTINGQPASAYLYANVESLKADARLISPDGTTLDKTSVAWISTPRFYARGNVIVLYVGLEEDVIGYLDTLFGQPFAGAPGDRGNTLPPPVDGIVDGGTDGGDLVLSDPLPIDADPLPVDPGDSVARLRPHITGTIDSAEFLEEADASGLLGRFLVRGDGTTNYDQAWVEILRDTQISFDGESFAAPTLADLAPGQTVAVIFSGPVRESYPVQAVAGQIVIRR